MPKAIKPGTQDLCRNCDEGIVYHGRMGIPDPTPDYPDRKTWVEGWFHLPGVTTIEDVILQYCPLTLEEEEIKAERERNGRYFFRSREAEPKSFCWERLNEGGRCKAPVVDEEYHNCAMHAKPKRESATARLLAAQNDDLRSWVRDEMEAICKMLEGYGIQASPSVGSQKTTNKLNQHVWIPIGQVVVENPEDLAKILWDAVKRKLPFEIDEEGEEPF